MVADAKPSAAFITDTGHVESILTKVGEPPGPRPIAPAWERLAWDDAPAPLPYCDLVGQAGPDFEFDQRIAWWLASPGDEGAPPRIRPLHHTPDARPSALESTRLIIRNPFQPVPWLSSEIGSPTRQMEDRGGQIPDLDAHWDGSVGSLRRGRASPSRGLGGIAGVGGPLGVVLAQQNGSYLNQKIVVTQNLIPIPTWLKLLRAS